MNDQPPPARIQHKHTHTGRSYLATKSTIRIYPIDAAYITHADKYIHYYPDTGRIRHWCITYDVIGQSDGWVQLQHETVYDYDGPPPLLYKAEIPAAVYTAFLNRQSDIENQK